MPIAGWLHSCEGDPGLCDLDGAACPCSGSCRAVQNGTMWWLGSQRQQLGPSSFPLRSCSTEWLAGSLSSGADGDGGRDAM